MRLYNFVHCLSFLAMAAPMLAGGTSWGVNDKRMALGEEAVVDVDESRTNPVSHRFIHGTIGDADFQVCLPGTWNGKLIVTSRGIAGDEFSFEATYKLQALNRGYAFAQTDEGWALATIAAELDDSYIESKSRIIQITKYAKNEVNAHYGTATGRTYLVGFSNGGHHVRWLVEKRHGLFDGGISAAGFNSVYEQFKAWAIFGRSFDVITPRIGDIASKRASSPSWDHTTEPLSPPLTAEQIAALSELYETPGELKHGFAYTYGQSKGTEASWGFWSDFLVNNFLAPSLGEIDPSYDPNEDGVVSTSEAKAWNPSLRPKTVERNLRMMDVKGNLGHPIVMTHGTIDTIVSPDESRAYKALLQETLGVAMANELVRLYLFPGRGHEVPPPGSLIDALDSWVTFIESGGERGAVPGVIGGIPPQP